MHQNCSKCLVLIFIITDCFDDPHETKLAISTTLTNRKCQEWNKKSPHDLTHALANATFPDKSTSELHNYCWSPVTGNSYKMPYLWCMTNDPDMLFDICSVPRCYSKGLHTLAFNFSLVFFIGEIFHKVHCKFKVQTTSTKTFPYHATL